MDRTRGLNKPYRVRTKKAKHKAIDSNHQPFIFSIIVVAGVLALVALFIFSHQ